MTDIIIGFIVGMVISAIVVCVYVMWCAYQLWSNS